MQKLSDIQILKLGKTLYHIKNNNLFYSQMFTNGRITSYKELAKLPFMTWQLLAQGYPFAYCCADTETLSAGYIQSQGQEKIMNLYSDSDISHIAEMTSRAFSIADISDEDTLLLISGEDTSRAFTSTCEKLRHFMIPAHKLSHKELYQLIKDTDASYLLGDTSDLIKFVEDCRTSSLELSSLGLKGGVFSGKPLTEWNRKHIEKETGMDITLTAGIGDFFNGLASDCKMHDGFHVWDEHYIVEIINPETGETVEDETEGELVITTVSLNALPLIRFRTGKLTKIIDRSKCECGLKTVKIAYTF
ncbi:MAG: hypothetical protein C0602_04900 [Denitrovibrio sp.]|nr:MAG: hypothetical protein C0602_04900 [Denitrovibrio sp.]